MAFFVCVHPLHAFGSLAKVRLELTIVCCAQEADVCTTITAAERGGLKLITPGTGRNLRRMISWIRCVWCVRTRFFLSANLLKKFKSIVFVVRMMLIYMGKH